MTISNATNCGVTYDHHLGSSLTIIIVLKYRALVTGKLYHSSLILAGEVKDLLGQIGDSFVISLTNIRLRFNSDKHASLIVRSIRDLSRVYNLELAVALFLNVRLDCLRLSQE